MPTMTNTEAYNILGVPNKATEAVVKSAYKRLALQTHPDKNPNDPDASKKFHRISEAYKRIIDPASFHDEDGEGEDISEQEMAAMFSMMFSEIFSGGTGGMESRMYEIWGDSEGDGGDDEDDEMEPGGMGGMFHMMEMMMNDDAGEYDDEDEDDEDYEDDDENINLQDYLPDGMGFNISGGQKKNNGKDKTMERLMASMGLSQSAGDYCMENFGDQDDDEDCSDDENAKFDAGQIGRGMKKGLTENQMIMLMQEMLMPFNAKSFGSSSSQAKRKSSCRNGHNNGQNHPKISGSSGGKKAKKNICVEKFYLYTKRVRSFI